MMELRDIPIQMRHFALHAMGKSLVESIFSEFTNPYAHAIGVVHCAQGAELILKARIAFEHPLLIFEKLPKPSVDDQPITASSLFDNARTVSYSSLPDLLWAATGVRVPDRITYDSFGRLRKSIVHLGTPPENLSEKTLNFAFRVIEPLIGEFWSESITEYMTQYDPDCMNYLIEQLEELEIPHSYPRDA
jgi:hypothetical protein